MAAKPRCPEHPDTMVYAGAYRRRYPDEPGKDEAFTLYRCPRSKCGRVVGVKDDPAGKKTVAKLEHSNQG